MKGRGRGDRRVRIDDIRYTKKGIIYSHSIYDRTAKRIYTTYGGYTVLMGPISNQTRIRN